MDPRPAHGADDRLDLAFATGPRLREATLRHDPSFLELIRADLDDDTPRLVYADWLTQKGARYGAFIVASCALAEAERAFRDYGLFTELRLPPMEEPAHLVEVRARANQVLRKNRKDWVPEALQADAFDVQWRRGFIDYVRLGADQLGLPILELAPALSSLHLTCPEPRLVLDAPMLDHLRCLKIWKYGLANPAPAFAPREPVASLRALSLSDDLSILRHPRFVELRELSIAGTMDRRAAEILASLSCRPSKLNVAHAPIGDAGWNLLARWLEGVDVLNAKDTNTTSEAICVHLNPNIRAVDLSGNALGEAAVEALCAKLERIEFLDLRGCFRTGSPLIERCRNTFGNRVFL